MASFSSELKRLRRGVFVAWLVNFLLLALTILAAMLFVALPSNVTNEELLRYLLLYGGVAVVVAAIILAFVMLLSSSVVMGSVGGDHERVTSGQLYNIAEEMSIASGMKVPDVYIQHGTGVANAYALSNRRGHARVVFTAEILQTLDRSEVQAVMAHELSHVYTGDSVAMTRLIALTSTVGIIAGLSSRMFYGRRGGGGNNGKANPLAIVIIVLSLIFLLVAPILSRVGNAFMSRKRESQADANAVRFTRNPTAMASALAKIDGYSYQSGADNQKGAEKFYKTVGALAFFNPAKFAGAFATHPPIGERVDALVKMGAAPPRAPGT